MENLGLAHTDGNELALNGMAPELGQMVEVYSGFQLSTDQLAVIQRGLELYLDETRNPEAQDKIEQFRERFSGVITLVESKKQAEQQLEIEGQKMDAATDQLEQAHRERNILEADRGAEAEQYGEAKAALNELHAQAREQKAQHSTFAVYSFSNPLASKAGYYAGKVGQVVLPLATAATPMLQSSCRELFTNRAVGQLGQCAASLSNTTTIVAGTVLALGSVGVWKLFGHAKKLIADIENVRAVEQQLQAADDQHHQVVAEFEARRSGIDVLEENGTATIQQSRAMQQVLQREAAEADTKLSQVRQIVLGKIAERSINQLERKLIEKEVDMRDVIDAIDNIGDAAFLASSETLSRANLPSLTGNQVQMLDE